MDYGELLRSLYTGDLEDMIKNEDAMNYFRKHWSISPYRKSSDCERDSRGRIKIFIMRSKFVPKQQVTYRIRRMIQTRHSGPYVTWDEFSEHRKLRLFDELKYHFCWDEKYDEQVYNLWEDTACEYLHEVLSKARDSGVKPSWIYDRDWSIMLTKWEKSESDQINKSFSLKRSSSMVEEELRIAKSQRKNEELTAAPEADTEASSHGENELAPCTDHEGGQDTTSKAKDKVGNVGKMIQEQVNAMNELSARMTRQEQMNENTDETMVQFKNRVQIVATMLDQVFGK